MNEENTILENEHQRLICSPEFDKALSDGAAIRSEIDGTFKTRNKNNYDRFYDIMLMSRDDINEILDKKKKNRTDAENKILKDFNKQTKMQYKFVREMLFLSENERLNDDGTENHVPKKVRQIVDKISAVLDILRYISDVDFNNTLDSEFNKKGITLSTGLRLEDKYKTFESEDVKKDMIDIFMTSCEIQRCVDDAETRIKEEVFTDSVPSQLQYDKQSNPSGLHDTDFKKLVNLKYKMMKAENSDSDAKEKANEQTISEAEKRTFDIERNQTIRAGLMAMGYDENEGVADDENAD